MRDAVIVSAARTAVGKAPRGSLRETPPSELAMVAVSDRFALASLVYRPWDSPALPLTDFGVFMAKMNPSESWWSQYLSVAGYHLAEGRLALVQYAYMVFGRNVLGFDPVGWHWMYFVLNCMVLVLARELMERVLDLVTVLLLLALYVLVLGGHVILPGQGPMRADVAIIYDDALARTGAKVRDVGDLRDVVAIDTVDARGLFLHPQQPSLTSGPGGLWLRLGSMAAIDIRRGADAASDLVRTIGGPPER